MLENLTYIPLFRDLDPAQSALLGTLFEHFESPTETVIFEQGSRASHLYLILKGTVSIQYKPYDGPPIIITRLKAGDLCGWSAVVGGKTYTSGCISTSQVEAIRIAGSDLWNLAKKHPELGRIILNRLASIVSPRWENAHTQVQAMLDEKFKKNDKKAKQQKEAEMLSANASDREVQIRELVQKISSYVEQFHGGTVDVTSFDGKTVKVHLGGACLNCPLLPSTLHGWVEGTIHQFFPDVDVIEEK